MNTTNREFINDEYYHIFNRGTEKRGIFLDQRDTERFFQSMTEFNVVMPIGSIYENSFNKNRGKDQLGSPTSKLEHFPKLVNFVCYCLNPNHYHFILEPLVENGIAKFMQRIGTGYTKYFNNKYKRNGVLFQGKYKSIHINSNDYLLHLSAYVNLNNKIHSLGSPTPKLSESSWDEYINEKYTKKYTNTNNDNINNDNKNFCSKNIILEQFNSKEEYQKFAEEALTIIKENKEAKKFLLE